MIRFMLICESEISTLPDNGNATQLYYYHVVGAGWCWLTVLTLSLFLVNLEICLVYLLVADLMVFNHTGFCSLWLY